MEFCSLPCVLVMPGRSMPSGDDPWVPGIHVCSAADALVDGRDKPGHDDEEEMVRGPAVILRCERSEPRRTAGHLTMRMRVPSASNCHSGESRNPVRRSAVERITEIAGSSCYWTPAFAGVTASRSCSEAVARK